LAAGIFDTDLPPVSTTQAVLLAKFAASVVDTCGKFASLIDKKNSN
jgi:hypothetical protein